METDAGGVSVIKESQTPRYMVMLGMVIMLILQIADLTADVSTNIQVNNPSTEKTLTAARDDVVVIGINWNWPPYCWATTSVQDDGAPWDMPYGFLYEFAVEACDRAGLNCRFTIMGLGQVDCWTGDGQGQVGTALQSGMFDMCLCYTVTPTRLGRALWPTNDEKGWTMPAMGGLLTLKAYQRDDTDFWRILDQNWTDGCSGAQMIDVGPDRSTGLGAGNIKSMRRLYRQVCSPGTDSDADCSDYSSDDYAATGENTKACPQGKIRVGLIKGWALSEASFGWVTNSMGPTTGDFAQKFDPSRVVFVDEHHDDSGALATIRNYNHLAKAVEDRTIDVAYTYSNLLESMKSETCAICADSSVWTDNTLTWRQVDLAFASGGASGFFKMGDVALRDAIDTAGKEIIADTEWYCPKCREFWPQPAGCASHCIGCQAAGYCNGMGGTSSG